MKKLFLVSVLALLSTQVFAGVKEATTNTSDDSICETRGLNLKQKMQEIDELIASSGGTIERETESKSINQ